MRILFRSLAVGLVLMPMLAAACSCMKRSLDQQYDDATAVFVGRIGNIREVGRRTAPPNWPGREATFTVTRELKGHALALNRVETGLGNGDCGVPLVAGALYLLLVDANGEIDICSGSRALLVDSKQHNQTLRQLENLAARKL